MHGQSVAGHLIAIWQLGHCWRPQDGGVGHNKTIYAQAQGHSSNIRLVRICDIWCYLQQS